MATRIMGRTTEAELPYGIGRLGGGFVLLATALLALVGVGAYAYTRQFMEGEAVTGMRDIGTMGGAPWGLYIAFDAYIVGVGFAGITTAALIRILNLEYLRPISRAAELLTVVALILASFTVMADLGNPGRGIINLFKYARPSSPFFGTFALVISGSLFASALYLFLDGRRDAALLAQKPSRLQPIYRLWAAGYRDTPEQRRSLLSVIFWLALAIIPLLVIARLTLGLVFGTQAGQAGWFGAIQAPGFVIMAAVSGVGILIIVAAVLRQVLGEKKRINGRAFGWLSNVMWVLTLTYLSLLVVEWLTSSYFAQYPQTKIVKSLVAGEYAWLFWLTVGLLAVAFVLSFLQFALQRYNVPLMVVSGVLVNAAAFAKAYLIVVPSQTKGAMLWYLPGAYSPTLVEYGVVVGLVAFGIFLYLAFAKVFPILTISETTERG